MTKIVLTDELKQMALQQYHPRVDIVLWSLEQEEYDDTYNEIVINGAVNIKILNKDIEKMLATEGTQYLEEYQKYVSKPNNNTNDKCTNVIFTPYDDISTIIPFEYYKDVFYLELPTFYRTISLHILTDYYDASDDVILFHTEDIIEYVNSEDAPEEAWVCSNGASRDIDKVNINIAQNGFGRYLIKLPYALQHGASIEIDAFYKYMDSFNGDNQIGVVDSHIRGYDDIEKEYSSQQTLINTNLEDKKGISTMGRDPNYLDILDDRYFEYSTLLDYKPLTHRPSVTYESIVKYTNDDIYIEEYNEREVNASVDRVSELQTESNNYNYIFYEWPEE